MKAVGLPEKSYPYDSSQGRQETPREHGVRGAMKDWHLRCGWEGMGDKEA